MHLLCIWGLKRYKRAMSCAVCIRASLPVGKCNSAASGGGCCKGCFSFFPSSATHYGAVWRRACLAGRSLHFTSALDAAGIFTALEFLRRCGSLSCVKSVVSRWISFIYRRRLGRYDRRRYPPVCEDVAAVTILLLSENCLLKQLNDIWMTCK